MTIAEVPSPGTPLKTTGQGGGHGTSRSTAGRPPKGQHDDQKDASAGDVAVLDVFGALLQAMIPGQVATKAVATADRKDVAGSLLTAPGSTNKTPIGAAASGGSGLDAKATAEGGATTDSGAGFPTSIKQPTDGVKPEPSVDPAHAGMPHDDRGAPSAESGVPALAGRSEAVGSAKLGLLEMRDGPALAQLGQAHKAQGSPQPGSPAATQFGAQTATAGVAAPAGEHRPGDSTSNSKVNAIAGTPVGASSKAPVAAGQPRPPGDPARQDQAKNGGKPGTTSVTAGPATLGLDVKQATTAGPGGAVLAGDGARVAPSDAPPDYVPSPHVVEQVKGHLLRQILNQSLSRNGNSTIVIRLDPPSLGKVQVRIEKGEGTRIQVHFRVEDRGARDALVNGWDQLDRALRAEGYSPDNLSVEMNPFTAMANDTGSAGNGGWPTDSGHQPAPLLDSKARSSEGAISPVEAAPAVLANPGYYVDYIL